jgi:hypothetical protein
MKTWTKLVSPIARRCRLAASLNLATQFDAAGSLALAAVLEDMAAVIDNEIAVRAAAATAIDVLEGRS